MELFAFLADDGDHLPQVLLHLAQGPLQLSGLIVAVDTDRLLQVALGDHPGRGDQLAQRLEDGTQQLATKLPEDQAGDQDAAREHPGGIAHAVFARPVGLLDVFLDQAAERFVAPFQLLEGLDELRQLGPCRHGIEQRLADDALGGADVGFQVGPQLDQRLVDGVVERQPLVLLDHLAKPLAVLLQVLADLLGRRAVAGLDHERRQDVGAQGVVHHVAFHVVAQRIDAQLVLRQRLAQPQLPPEADPA